MKAYAIILLFVAACAARPTERPSQNEEFCSQIHRNDSIDLEAELNKIPEIAEGKTGVFVLEDGGTSLIARAWLTEYAERTIDVQYFIFSPDNVGLIACDYLVRAADRGVKVRLLVDDIMVDAGIHEILTLDSHENISIKIYNPGVNLGKNLYDKIRKFATDFRSANQRMHNKTFTVDRKVSITGGRNIADEYFDYDHEYNFRDRDVLLLGKVASDIETSFEDFWDSEWSVPVSRLVADTLINDQDTARFDRLHQYACNPENFWPEVRQQIVMLPQLFRNIQASGRLVWMDSISFVSDIPGKNDGKKGLNGGGATTDTLIYLIRNAKKSIDIQSPYLITTGTSRKVFQEAVNRGVKIRILTNSMASTDNMEAFSGYQRDRAELLESGVRIFEFRPDAAERFKVMTGAVQKKLDFKPIFGLHAKTMVVDGNICVIGTFNLDPRSANLNTECVAIIHSGRITADVLRGMEEEFKPENSWETTPSYNPDGEAGRMKRLKTWAKKIIPKEIL